MRWTHISEATRKAILGLAAGDRAPSGVRVEPGAAEIAPLYARRSGALRVSTYLYDARIIGRSEPAARDQRLVPRKLWTLREAAESLDRTPATLRQQIANGRLKARKAGRDWRISEDEIARYRLESLGKPGRPRKAKEDPA